MLLPAALVAMTILRQHRQLVSALQHLFGNF